MGYDSYFSISVEGSTREERKQVLNEIEEISGYEFDSVGADDSSANLDEAHWYNYREDCAKVAMKHPEIFIEVYREGEERDDTEMTRFHKDKMESVTAQTAWPPFRDIMMPGEKPVETTNEVPSEKQEESFFDEAEYFGRKLMNTAIWRHVFGVIFDHRSDDGIKSPAEELLKLVEHIVNDIESSGKELIIEWYNGNEDLSLNVNLEDFTITEKLQNLSGFEEAKESWVKPWKEAIKEIRERTKSGELSLDEVFPNLNICNNSITPIKGSCYMYMNQYYASIIDLLMITGFKNWLIEDSLACATADYLENYVNV